MARIHYKKQLEQLNDQMITMGSMIENTITTAITALVSQDTERAEEVIAYDYEIDAQERNIEQHCYQLLLMQQPVAGDLRVVSATMKMVTDMERIGDHAADISELTLLMAGKPYVSEIMDIEQMAKETTVMVTKSVDAYVNRDLEMAREVISADDAVDDLFKKVRTAIIGDHATNIAERVIFMLTGEYV